MALAPEERESEASFSSDLLTDGSGKKKKKRKRDRLSMEGEEEGEDEEDEDNDDFAGNESEEDGERGRTIVERLALLSSAIEHTDKEDSEEEEDEENDSKE